MILDVMLIMVLGFHFNLMNCRHPCLILPFLLEGRAALGMIRLHLLSIPSQLVARPPVPLPGLK